MSSTRDALQEIFRDMFDDEDIVLNDDTSAKDIKGWDSLNNVKLIVNIERKFGIRFSTGEIVSLNNVRNLLDLIEKKQGNV
jgi:acyl carrier protein